MALNNLNDVEHIRTRPTMYVGSLGLQGLMHYFASAVNLYLKHSPTWIALAARDDCFEISSDATIDVAIAETGEVMQFEKIVKLDHGFSIEGTVLNSLSSTLSVVTKVTDGKIEHFLFTRGQRVESAATTWSELPEGTGSVIRFSPDPTIFDLSSFSEFNLESYLHRISFLNPRISFSWTNHGDTHTFHAPNGICDLFSCIASPYQIVHQPVHFRHVTGELDLELIWGFHSWKGDVVCSFINKGCAVDGGTHDQGLAAAFRALPTKIGIPNATRDNRNGIVAIMSIIYPNAEWDSATKQRIGGKVLRPLVRKIVVEQSLAWIESHPPIGDQMRKLHTFYFPDMWIAEK